MSADTAEEVDPGTGTIVAEVLSPHELTRLWGLMGFLSAAEVNTRSVSMLLGGLKARDEGIAVSRDLQAAIALVDSVVARYTTATNEVYAEIQKLRASSPLGEAIRSSLH